MANPTTNYSFAMPTNSDLVKDLPADFEVFGQAVDTQMKTNADAATQKATLTTKGDIYAATGASTPARLAVGTDGQALIADSTTATGIKWGAVAAGDNWSLLNAGGTALTGAQTVTISGISGQNKILVLVEQASSANVSAVISVRFNGDTGSNYNYYGMRNGAPAAGYNINLLEDTSGADNKAPLGTTSGGSATGRVSGYLLAQGCNSSGVKAFNSTGTGNSNSGNGGQFGYSLGGYYNSSSTISSVSVFSSTGNLDAGTVYVYATA